MLELPAAPPRGPSSRKVALATAAAFFAAVAIAEAVARRVVPFQPPVYCSHPYAGHVFAPDLRLEYATLGGRGPTIALETNAFGFRGKSMTTAAKPEGTCRIFFQGASVVAGVDFEEEETFSGLVESALSERWKGSPRVECPNAGMSGVAIAHTLAMLAHRVVPHEPDAVVIYDGVNDALRAIEPGFDRTHYSQRVESPDNLSRWLGQNVRLLQLASQLRKKRGWNPFLERPPIDLTPKTPLGRMPEVDAHEGLLDFRAYLDMIGAIATKLGIRLVVATHAVLWRESPPYTEEERARLKTALRYGSKVDVPALARLHARYQDELRAFAREGGHLLVDVDAALPKDAAHFHDDVHPSLEGNRVVARLIADAIDGDPTIRARALAGKRKAR